MFQALSEFEVLKAVIVDDVSESEIEEWDKFVESSYQQAPSILPYFLAVPVSANFNRVVSTFVRNVGRYTVAQKPLDATSSANPPAH